MQPCTNCGGFLIQRPIVDDLNPTLSVVGFCVDCGAHRYTPVPVLVAETLLREGHPTASQVWEKGVPTCLNLL